MGKIVVLAYIPLEQALQPFGMHQLSCTSKVPSFMLGFLLKLTVNGAVAEELGKGLQNPVHECKSRPRLQGRWRNWYTRLT